MSKIDERFRDYFRRVKRRVEEGYRIPVEVCDVLDPNTGSFDGSKIWIDYANSLEMSLFVLVHLFGHTVQWNLVPEYRTIDQRVRPGCDETLLEESRVYELNASRYGLSLLHEEGILDLDQWLADWRGSDWEYLSHFYRTGVLGNWEDFRRSGHELIRPLEIPSFTTGAYSPRYAF
jgi:hypothetical protein